MYYMYQVVLPILASCVLQIRAWFAVGNGMPFASRDC